MYKLVIADDEAMICSLIKRLIDWETLPLTCVGVASNGTQCLDMVREHAPDIVITDIRMPGLSGLELIAKCIEENNAVRFIIISGYAQFDYAQRAIKYGVSDFLIKPIQRDELNDSLRRLVGVLRGDREAREVKAPVPDMRHALVLSLLLKDFPTDRYADVQALNQAYGYRFEDAGQFLPVAVCLDARGGAQEHAQSVLAKIEGILRDEIGPRCADFAIVPHGQAVYALFQFPRSAMDGLRVALQYAFDRMLGVVQPYALYHVTMGVGSPADLAGLQEAFARAVCAVEGRRHLGLNALYDGSTLDLQLADTSRIAVREPNHALVSALQGMDTDGFSAFFLQEYQRQMPDMQRFAYSLGAYSRGFFAAFCRDVRAACGVRTMPQAQETTVLTDLDECLTGEEISARLDACARAMSGVMQSARPDLKAIQQVKVYIDSHYPQRITLEDAAGEVFLSPAYLGILFKRETGENFSDYLAAVRIEKAKALLGDIRLNVNEVSRRVGYKNTQHFSKLFKRSVGITPAQYRKFISPDDGARP